MHRRLLALLVVFLCTRIISAAELRVMTFNLWHGGDAGGQPLKQSAEVVRAAKADLVGFQETDGQERNGVRPNRGKEIADLLGWHYLDQGQGTGIASRFPIVSHTPARWGATVELSEGRRVTVFNVHFAHAPYQPYQLLRIPYADAPFITTAAEAVREARAARGGQVERMLAEAAPLLARGETLFLTGDFNEPSFQDWTERAAAAKKCPLPVPYPTTRLVTEAGFRDAFRATRPDEVLDTGWTWTPLTRPDDPADRHDRIDFVFFSGNGVSPITSQIIGENAAFANVVVQPYPSDHRAVVVVFRLQDKESSAR